jgi:hypothetical protein
VYSTVIICVYSDGSPASGVEVALGFSFSDHPLSAGVTESAYTKDNGWAKVYHLNTGTAYVYLDGEKQDRTIRAPRRYSFTV